ncbi:MAG TPA: deoxyribonuclease IV [Chloroflexota bacterium]|jgi:deoxyribonuclease-4|nr:deoxyribonuclease IV [Chloroflexota bacterium]
MRVGAHVSTRGHVWEAIGRATDIGAECIQVFVSYPQRWMVPRIPEEDAQEFRHLAAQHDIRPAYLHAIYLINFGSPDPDLYEKSIHALAQYLNIAGQLGALGVIAHMGSALSRPVKEAEEAVALGLEAALRKADNEVAIVIENNAGSGNCLGSTFDQIGRFIDMCDGDERLQVCLDTAHTFASGYDYPNAERREAMFEEIEHSFGLSRIRAVHVNDSKARFGSGVDRHENLGDGFIGLQGLQDILLPLAKNDCDFILEVPGYEGHGPDRENLETLRKLLAGEPVEVSQPALFA